MGNQDSPDGEVTTLGRVHPLSPETVPGHQLPPLATRPPMYPRLSAAGIRGTGGDVTSKASLGVVIGGSEEDLDGRADFVPEVTFMPLR